MAAFYNQATLSYRGTDVVSNITTGEITESLTASKTAVTDSYGAGDEITYVVSLVNTGTDSLENLTLTDDLGAYEADGQTLEPLSYVDGSILYFGTSGSATAAGFKSTNTATIASGTLFDASAFESGKKLVEGVDSSLDVSKFTLSSLRVNGATVNSRGASATFAVQDGTLVLSAYTAGTVYNLT